MRKGCLAAAIVVLAIPFLFFFSFIGIGPLLNNIAAWGHQREFEEMPMPADTRLVGTYTFCGNSGGTGNHVEILVGNVIYSNLPQDELDDFFAPRNCVALNFDDNKYIRPSLLAMYFGLDDEVLSEGYYCIVEESKAVTQWDVRGH